VPAITNPGRVLYPDSGITKGDLARYFASVADFLVPEIAGRPLTLVRCPAGIGAGCFFQKHLAEGVPEALRGVEIEEQDGGTATYVVADSRAGLLALAQLGVIEIHTWG
jgi:bifunctional non-homologous end joining protein LigD